MSEWPWPDSTVDRIKRVATIYRDRLADEAPAACAEIDEVMAAFGQRWIIHGGGYAIDPDLLMTVAEIAEVADVGQSAVRNWICRWPLIARGIDDSGRALYRWGDVESHSNSHRSRAT